MNNHWNKVIYKIWSPFYDKIFNSGVFLQARKQLFQELSFPNEHRILFVGVGTGADLELFHADTLDITAIDFSPDMLDQARAKFKGSNYTFLEMDAQDMKFANESFDFIVASLILSVVPDADRCFQEMARVLKNDGKILIFDKFTLKNQKQSILKRLVRPIIKILGTDIGLNFEKLVQRNHHLLKIEEDKPLMMNGMYRKIIMSKMN